MTIQTFDFEGVPVRDVLVSGVPWFVGKDVCGILGIVDHKQALSSIPDDERGWYIIPPPSYGDGVGNTDPLGRNAQEMICVNEPGLYRLIFKSRKPEAERFKKWVFHEVLPAIRATGTYQARPQPEARTLDETLIAIPAAKYIEMLEFKIAVLQEKANPPRKEKRPSRGPLTDDEFQRIRELAKQGLSQTEICRAVGRASSSVSMALRICPVLPAAEGGAQ